MLIKIIACEVFTREICHCTAISPHVIDLEFTPKGAHDEPDSLRNLIQERINAANDSDKEYDAIALGLGLCGNAITGLTSSPAPLIIPRAHDCCTIFLGSKDRFKELFEHKPSTPFSSTGYAEHGGFSFHDATSFSKQMGMDMTYEECLEKYGKENGEYLWETLRPENPQTEAKEIVFIEMPGFPDTTCAEDCRKQAEEKGLEFVNVEGSIELLRKLAFGEWNNDEFLTIKPGESIAGVYDMDEVIKANS